MVMMGIGLFTGFSILWRVNVKFDRGDYDVA